MQSPLSRFQTPTASRQVSRFFRVWWLRELLRRANHPAYFGLANIICANPFGHRLECSLGYAPANGSCEEAVNVETCTTTLHVRPPLSRFLTPASSRNVAGFFGSGYSPGRPDRASRLAYFGLTKFPRPTLSAEVGGQAVLGRQDASPTPWLTERHGYDPTFRVRLLAGSPRSS